MQNNRDNYNLIEKVTPPSSFIKTPFTPPPTDSKPTKLVLNILQLIWQFKCGHPVSESEWHTFKLRRGEYDNLLILLEKNESLWTFVETKLRYV